MRLMFSFLMVFLLSFGLVVNEAAAKRFGGGRALGFSRSTTSYSKATPKQSYVKQNKSSRWRSGLAGFLLGGLLASLFFGHGFGSALFSWLILIGLAFIILRLIYRLRHRTNKRDWH
jgi:predicted lipid-binding transport protein (Tim44 family)